jgi:hypothetical protein
MLFAFNKVNRSRKFLVSKDAVSDGNLTASNHRNQQQRVRIENNISRCVQVDPDTHVKLKKK